MNKIFLLLLFSTHIIFSQGFQVNLQGQKQQGMGGAGTAYVQDGAIVFFNPAGMSFLKENSVQLGATSVIANIAFLDARTNNLYRTQSPITTPFSAYAVWGSKKENLLGKFKFGLGVYTPFGSIVKWEDAWTGRFNLTALQLFALFIQPSISYKITDKLSAGVGFVYATGNVKLDQDIPIINTSGQYGHAELSGKANGYGFNAGVYYQLNDKISFGFTHRSKVVMSLNDGTATFNVPTSLSSKLPSGTFKSNLPLPSITTIGMAFKASAKLSFALDVNYNNWKPYDTLAFDYQKNTDQLHDTKLPRLYKSVFSFRLGAQYVMKEKFYFRGGCSISLTPIPDNYITPEVPDANRINTSVGLGYNLNNKFVIDASYTLEVFTRKALNNNQTIGPVGTYKTYVSAPGLSIMYKF